MKVVILGFGRFGQTVASAFSRGGHEVTVVDLKDELVEWAESIYDLRAFAGHGSYPEVLEKAGVDNADMLLAATGNDEVNMIACQLCANLYGTPLRIARLQSRSYIDQPKVFSTNDTIDAIVTPEDSLAENLSSLADFPGASEMIDLENLYLFAVRVLPNSEVLGQSPEYIKELLSKEEDIWLAAIARDRSLLDQDQDLNMQAYDSVYFCSRKKPPSRLISLFGQSVQRRKKALVIGGGEVGLRLAELLLKKNFHVNVVEEREERAEFIAMTIKSGELDVYNQSALDGGLLQEIVEDEKDLTAISVTDRDEVNLLSLLTIKEQNPEVRTISLLNERRLLKLIHKFQLDVGVFTWNITLPLVTRYLRRSGVFEMNYPLLNCDAHCLLIRIVADSFLVGKTPCKLSESHEILPIAIKRGDDFHESQQVVDLEIDDILVCLVRSENLEKVERSFSSHLILF